MSRRLAGIVAITLVVLAIPRESDASFWDYIWEMSGPQMFQLASISYPVAFQKKPPACKVSRVCVLDDNGGPSKDCNGRVLSRAVFLLNDGLLKQKTCRETPENQPTGAGAATQSKDAAKPKPVAVLHIADPEGPKFWLLAEGTVYASTGKNSGNDEYTFGRTFVFAVEPLFEYRYAHDKHATYYAGAGISYQYLTGTEFDGYDKFALKFRPWGVILARHVDIGYNVRLYPHGFMPDEFGHGERKQNSDRPAEVTWGVSVGILW